jgi:hypothetical protein
MNTSWKIEIVRFVYDKGYGNSLCYLKDDVESLKLLHFHT